MLQDSQGHVDVLSVNVALRALLWRPAGPLPPLFGWQLAVHAMLLPWQVQSELSSCSKKMQMSVQCRPLFRLLL